MNAKESIRWALAAEAVRLRRDLDRVLRELRKLEGKGLARHNAEMDRMGDKMREEIDLLTGKPKPKG